MENLTTTKTWRNYLPGLVYLHHIDQNTTLEDCPTDLQKCISDNSFYPIWEIIDNWYPDPLEYEMFMIKKKMEKDGMLGEYCDNEEDIREWLYDHDLSTPLEDLLHITGDCMWFYSLGEWFYDLWDYNGCYDEKEENEDVATMCKILGIPSDSEQVAKIREIRQNATYGGELRIYFKAPLDKLISDSSEDDFKTIRFRGIFSVYIHNPNEGAGYSEDIELDKTFNFERDNLFHIESDRYDAIETYGIDHSCIANGEIAMLKAIPAETEEIKISIQKAHMESEMNFEAVFRSGKCSKGDLKMSRHRSIEYRNSFPCGHVCKDCGTFWID